MTKTRQFDRFRIQAYVEADLAKRLAAYSAASCATSSAVVRAALLQYLDRTGDKALFLRRLDRLTLGQARTQRDLEFLSEAFAVFVRLWLAHTPRLQDEAKASARKTSGSRFAEFAQHVVDRFTAGERFLDALPTELIADDAELPRPAQGEPTDAPSDDWEDDDEE